MEGQWKLAHLKSLAAHELQCLRSVRSSGDVSADLPQLIAEFERCRLLLGGKFQVHQHYLSAPRRERMSVAQPAKSNGGGCFDVRWHALDGYRLSSGSKPRAFTVTSVGVSPVSAFTPKVRRSRGQAPESFEHPPKTPRRPRVVPARFPVRQFHRSPRQPLGQWQFFNPLAACAVVGLLRGFFYPTPRCHRVSLHPVTHFPQFGTCV